VVNLGVEFVAVRKIRAGDGLQVAAADEWVRAEQREGKRHRNAECRMVKLTPES
jgi:hypothetical protein